MHDYVHSSLTARRIITPYFAQEFLNMTEKLRHDSSLLTNKDYGGLRFGRLVQLARLAIRTSDNKYLSEIRLFVRINILKTAFCAENI